MVFVRFISISSIDIDSPTCIFADLRKFTCFLSHRNHSLVIPIACICISDKPLFYRVAGVNSVLKVCFFVNKTRCSDATCFFVKSLNHKSHIDATQVFVHQSRIQPPSKKQY